MQHKTWLATQVLDRWFAGSASGAFAATALILTIGAALTPTPAHAVICALAGTGTNSGNDTNIALSVCPERY